MIAAVWNCKLFWVVFTGVLDPAQSGQVDAEQTFQTHQGTTETPGANTPKAPGLSDNAHPAKTPAQITLHQLYMMLPHKPSQLYLSGVEEVFYNGQLTRVNMYFEAQTKQGRYYLTDKDIRRMGIKVSYDDECRAGLTVGSSKLPVYCSPSKIATTDSIGGI